MGIFDKFKSGLAKTRELLSSQIQSLKLQLGAFDTEQLEELEYALIQSDMGAENVDELISNLKAAMTAEGNVSSEFVNANLRAQLLGILGDTAEIKLDYANLNIFLMIGVNGAGKTTSCGKLAYRYTQAGKEVLICAADTFRAAAIEQLEVWAEQANARFICQKEGSDPAAVVYDAIKSAQAKKSDLLIVDTAGRLQNKKNLMLELEKISRIIKREAPTAKIFTFLVIDAANGQNALSQAVSFSQSCPIDAFILTKLDGSAKGGIAVAISKLKIAPIAYAGVGEGINDLIEFSAQDFVNALLPSEELDNKVQLSEDTIHVEKLNKQSDAYTLQEAQNVENTGAKDPCFTAAMADVLTTAAAAGQEFADDFTKVEAAEALNKLQVADGSLSVEMANSDAVVKAGREEATTAQEFITEQAAHSATAVPTTATDDKQIAELKENTLPAKEQEEEKKGKSPFSWFEKWFKQ